MYFFVSKTKKEKFSELKKCDFDVKFSQGLELITKKELLMSRKRSGDYQE